jgi:hypothetical protein
VATTSCGAGGDDEARDLRDVRAAVAELQAAFSKRDLASLCARMSRRAQRQAGRMAHGTPGPCAGDLREALRAIGGNWTATRPGRVEAIRVRGDRAAVTLARTSGTLSVPLVHEGGAWRLDSFFGTPEPVALRAAASTRRRPFPPVARGGAVEVLDGTGYPCFDPFVEDFPAIAGDCGFDVPKGRVTVTVATALGDFEFGECELTQRVVAGGDGRTWTTQFLFTWPVNNGCADIRPCSDDAGERLPWKGRLEQAGPGVLVHRVDACLETCVGFYTGRLVTRLTRTAGRWRLTGERIAVGASGLRIDARSPLPAGGLRAVRPGRS